MLKVLVSAVAVGVLAIGVGIAPAAAGQVYGDYGQGSNSNYDLDAPYSPNNHNDRYDDDRQYHGNQRYYRQERYRGCSRDRVAVGTGIGALAGGIIGNQFGHGRGRTAATIAGVIFGGIAGNAIARDGCRDERADAYYYNQAYYDAFDEPDYGRDYGWRNPYNGNYGTVTPLREYDDGERYGYNGECREFSQTIYIDGERTRAYGTACRQPNGSWKIVNY